MKKCRHSEFMIHFWTVLRAQRTDDTFRTTEMTARASSFTLNRKENPISKKRTTILQKTSIISPMKGTRKTRFSALWAPKIGIFEKSQIRYSGEVLVGYEVAFCQRTAQMGQNSSVDTHTVNLLWKTGCWICLRRARKFLESKNFSFHQNKKINTAWSAP